jgi:hypothetical protein
MGRRQRLSNVCGLACGPDVPPSAALAASPMSKQRCSGRKENAHRLNQDRPVLGRVKASARPSVVLASRYAGLEFDLCAEAGRMSGERRRGGVSSSGIRVVGLQTSCLTISALVGASVRFSTRRPARSESELPDLDGDRAGERRSGRCGAGLPRGRAGARERGREANKRRRTKDSLPLGCYYIKSK